MRTFATTASTRERSVPCTWCRCQTWNDDAVCDTATCRERDAAYTARRSA